MAKLITSFIICATALLFALYFSVTMRPQYVKIDCTIAEISPDIPPKAKEECRKLRTESIKNGK